MRRPTAYNFLTRAARPTSRWASTRRSSTIRLRPHGVGGGAIWLDLCVVYQGPACRWRSRRVCDRSFAEGANQLFSYIHFPVNVVNIYSDELSGQMFWLDAGRHGDAVEPAGGYPRCDDVTKLGVEDQAVQVHCAAAVQGVHGAVRGAAGGDDYAGGEKQRSGADVRSHDPVFDRTRIRGWAAGGGAGDTKIGRSVVDTGRVQGGAMGVQFVGQIGLKFFKMASSVKELKAA